MSSEKSASGHSTRMCGCASDYFWMNNAPSPIVGGKTFSRLNGMSRSDKRIIDASWRHLDAVGVHLCLRLFEGAQRPGHLNALDPVQFAEPLRDIAVQMLDITADE